MKNQIYYVTINKKFRNVVLQGITYPVVCYVKVKLRKLKTNRGTPKLQCHKLPNGSSYKEMYIDRVKNKYNFIETTN